MPARKPAGLITRAETKAKKAARVGGEAALKPRRSLPLSPPARLKGHEVAETTWRRMMRMYRGLEAEVVTGMDLDLLVDYCILTEQVVEMDHLRKRAADVYAELDRKLGEIGARRAELRKELTMLKAETEQEVQIEALHARIDKLDDQYLDVMLKMASAFEGIVKLDGRVDRKRDLVFKFRQSLYLTPRARAGAAPAQKEELPPPDDMEQLLDDINNTLNGKQDGQ
jgi:hypothetical protein